MEYTLTLRKVETGYKVTSFAMDDLQHAYSVATTIMQGPNYARCYLVCVDRNRAQMFVVHHGVPAAAPAAQGAPQPAYYSQPVPAQRPRTTTAPCLPAYRPGPPPQEVVLDAEFEDT